MYLGYVDGLSDKREYALNLVGTFVLTPLPFPNPTILVLPCSLRRQKLGFELNISAILNTDRDTAGMESLFSEVMREALRFLAFSQLTDDLEVKQCVIMTAAKSL